MKKRILALIGIGAACAVAAGCTFGKAKSDNKTSNEAGSEVKEEETSEKEPPEIPMEIDTEPLLDPDIYVTYYGCPRSKKVRALKTGKRFLGPQVFSFHK